MKQLTSFGTDRLHMELTDENDARFLIKLMNSPKWLQNIGDRDVKTLEDAKQYIKEKMKPQFDKLGYSNYTVIRKSDAVKLGTCGLYDRDGLDGIDIGFAFLPAYEKLGYAFESANALKEIAIKTLQIKKLRAITIEENTSSRRLLEKLGLRFKKNITIGDNPEALLLYEFIENTSALP